MIFRLCYSDFHFSFRFTTQTTRINMISLLLLFFHLILPIFLTFYWQRKRLFPSVFIWSHLTEAVRPLWTKPLCVLGVTKENITVTLSPFGHYIGMCFAFPLNTAILKLKCWQVGRNLALHPTCVSSLKQQHRTKSSFFSTTAWKHGSTGCDSHLELCMHLSRVFPHVWMYI